MTHPYAETRYRVKTTGASGKVYTSKEIDFFVGYVVPENIWYIIPIQAIGHRKNIRFYPTTRRQSKAMFEKYREAWCLLDSRLAVRLRQAPPPLPQQESGTPLRHMPPARLIRRMWRGHPRPRLPVIVEGARGIRARGRARL